MDQMQDTLADADEVRRVIEAGNEGMRRAAGEEELDEGEMEAELKKLEEENEREREEKIKKLPPVEVKDGQAKQEAGKVEDVPKASREESHQTEPVPAQ
jgi:hypothetical protein